VGPHICKRRALTIPAPNALAKCHEAHFITIFSKLQTELVFSRSGKMVSISCSWTFVTQAQFHIACKATPQQCTWTFDTYYKLLTNTQEVPTHSAAPSKCIHSSNPKSHKDETGKTSQKYRQELYRQERYSNPCSSVGTRTPARNPVPLDFACIPRHA
jgi:hypothetical protein